MNEATQKAIRTWSLLKKNKWLTPELDIDPNMIINSSDLHALIFSTYENKLIQQESEEKQKTAMCEKLKNEEISCKVAFDKVKSSFENEFKNGLKIWGGSHPFLSLPTNDAVLQFRNSPKLYEIRLKIINELKVLGYPTDYLTWESIALFSEEECEKQANGNWYNFLK